MLKVFWQDFFHVGTIKVPQNNEGSVGVCVFKSVNNPIQLVQGLGFSSLGWDVHYSEDHGAEFSGQIKGPDFNSE